MPPVCSSYIPINHEWAELLVGLCMKVPDNWWPDIAGQALNAGVIAGIDFEIATINHFQLELDKEQGIYYTMRYKL